MNKSDFETILKNFPAGIESAFPKEEYDRRIAALRVLMTKRGVDLLLVTGPENIFYLCGQQTPGYYTFQCLSVPVEGEPFHTLRNLEVINCRANTFLADLTGYDDSENPAEVLARAVAALPGAGGGEGGAPAPPKIVAAVSPDIPLDDRTLLLWGIFTRFDPARDAFFEESKLRGAWPMHRGRMAIDATFKSGYPAPLEMDPDIVKKVDRRWGEYGID